MIGGGDVSCARADMAGELMGALWQIGDRDIAGIGSFYLFAATKYLLFIRQKEACF